MPYYPHYPIQIEGPYPGIVEQTGSLESPTRKRTRWTDEEVALLKKHYGSAKTPRLLYLFPNRTAATIAAKASYLGLTNKEHG